MSGPRRPHRPTHYDPRHTTADGSTTNRCAHEPSGGQLYGGQLSRGRLSGNQSSGEEFSGEEALLYTPGEAAQRLRVRESWLRKKAAARQVPCTFLGKHLRFSPADLAAIVAASARPAVGRRGRRKPATASAPPSAAPSAAPSSSPSSSTVRDRDLPAAADRSVHPPDRDDHIRDGSSPWHG